MKKLIKRKLFYNSGVSKNFFLWEISGERGSFYEIIEEFKGKQIARAMLRGIYRDRMKALADFKRVVVAEAATLRTSPVHRLVFG
jgi:hypothetical protein